MGFTNGTILNGELPSSSAHSENGSPQKPQTPPAGLSKWEQIIDFVWFIITAIGHILQDFYYLIIGYPEKDLGSDVALITGGGNGLGRLLAQRLGKVGTKVVVWDINKEGINDTVNIVEGLGGYCKGYVVDISKREEVYKAAEVIRREVGDVTLLINNAGVVSGLHLLDTPDYLIERSFNVNVMAHFWTTKAFLPKMIENDRGHIATIASLAGHVGISKLVDYCASKFAAVGFDEALRLELEVLGHTNIQTTCICPFFIQQTGMFEDVNARWVPTLNPNDVADRVIKAIQTNQKSTIIPNQLKFLLSLKWTFPWGCIAGLLRRIVPDASPHGYTATVRKNSVITLKSTDIKSERISTDFTETMSKTTSLLIKRASSPSERVL